MDQFKPTPSSSGEPSEKRQGSGSRFAYHFKIAETPAEFEAIHRLLHRTFVREVRRYDDPGGDRLVDKFHQKNRYLIATQEERLCGMVAVHDEPPFSVTAALPDANVLLELCPRLLEARIFAVEPSQRLGPVFAGLAWSIHDYAVQGGFRYIAITGLSARRTMYRRMGFRPLAKAVRRGGELFVPMLLDLADLPENTAQNLGRFQRRRERGPGATDPAE